MDRRYDFVGNVLSCRECHGSDVLETLHEYDSRSRLLSSAHRLNGGAEARIMYRYDALGRVIEKVYGSTSERIGYNVRGWLASKRSAPFSMELRYESPAGGSAPCYNGNVSEWSWTQGANPGLQYGFAYDGFGRLASSSQQQWDGSSWVALSSDFVEKGLTYDRNGNLLTLQRTSGGVPVDDLSYTYTGNRLTGLEERVRTSPSGDVYRPGDAPSGTYAYDANGNLQKDTRKGLTFKSNRLNLLGEVYAGDTLKARYTYLSDGTKLCVRDGSGRNGYDYLGSFVYKVSEGRIALDRVLADGVQLTSSGVRYALTDHLGSVRALVDESGRVVRQTDYYPFGAQVSRPSYAVDSSRFLFSGKESQELLDLNAYDFGARMYDASLCRWQSVDPMCEKYADLSPYNYCVNNPLVYVDPDGMMLKLVGNMGDIVMALYNGLDWGSRVEFRFFNGFLDPFSLEKEAMSNSSLFIQDLYEVAMDEKIVELSFLKQNKYLLNGKLTFEDWDAPYDYDTSLDPQAEHLARLWGQPTGLGIHGNLGQTLVPDVNLDSGKSSINGNVQIIINAKGSLNHRTVGIAHELGHVILYLRGLPFSHNQPGVDNFTGERATEMSKRLGYDY